jgi:hypothetical protein
MQSVIASGQASSEGAESLRDKFSLGSTARNPKEDVMKRNSICNSSLFVLSLLLTVAGAHAQTAARASVPFPFQVTGHKLPAGTYSIKKEAGHEIIMIRNLKTGYSAMALAGSGLSGKTTNKLVFYHAGGQYFLSQIWGDAGMGGVAIPASKWEKELQVGRVTPKANNNVEVALK